MMLELKNTLTMAGVHPIRGKPVGVAVSIAWSAARDGSGQSDSTGDRSANVALSESIRCVTTDHEYFSRRVERGGRAERPRGIADVDHLNAAVCRQRRLEVDVIEIDGMQ